MRKIRMWWTAVNIAVRNRKEDEVEVRGFRFVFRRFSMDVRSLSGNWRMRVLCTEHSWGYLRESLRQGRMDNLEGFAVIMYSLAVSLTKDQKLVSDVTRDIKAYATRVERQAEKEGKMSEEDEAGALLHETMVAEKVEKKLNKRYRK